MSKRYLSLICLLYSGILGYVIIFDKIKNFLAPQMHIYIKLSIIPMFFIGLVMLFNNKVHYKFKFSDLILILPLVMLIIAGDGRLSSSFASNRTMRYNTEQRTKSEEKNDNVTENNQIEENIKLPKTEENTEKIEEPVEEKDLKKEIEKNITEPEEKHNDFSKSYFDIKDNIYNELADYITFAPKASIYEGKTIKVKGFALKNPQYIPTGYFVIGKYLISCCAADAEFTGFIALYDNNKITEDKWYEIEGILEKGTDNEGYDIMYIKVINIKEINSKDEEQYVYPCYSFNNNSCDILSKYNLEY